MTNRLQFASKRAFTLVEMLISIGVVSALAAIAVFGFTNLGSKMRDQKLMADVATLNSALKVYQANGGSLAGVRDPKQALVRLKTVSSNWKEIAGLRDSMVDERLDVEWVFTGTDPRVVWDESNQRFAMANSGRGVKAFVINEALSEAGVVEEAREANLKLATRDTWVWDYTDRGLASTPALLMPGSGRTPPPSGSGPSGVLKQLSPPEISKPGGDYPLGDFDLEVFLRNPNSTTISTLMVSVDSGGWREYRGEPIPAEIGTRVMAYAASTDPENWSDSRRVRHTYSAIPLQLQLDLKFAKSSFNYMELGGDMMPGIYAPVPADPGTIKLLNASQIPTRYMNETSFGVFVIVGTQAEARVAMDAGYSGELPVTLSSYGTGSEVDVTAIARTFIPVLADSVPHTETLGIEPMALRPPIVYEQPDPSGVIVPGIHYVIMELESSMGDMPVGARIYYTSDGSDPGDDGAGNPASPSARLYENPFLINQPLAVPIRARVYPPQSYAQWFIVSPISQIVWPDPPRITFSSSITLP